MTMLPVTYGYARVSKADDDSKNLETQLRILADHGIRDHLVYTDVASGGSLQRPGWQELMARLRSGDTLVVAFLDRLSRNFEDGVGIQAELTRQDIAIVALQENIDTRKAAPRPGSSAGPCWPRGPTKLKPRWDVHLPWVGKGAGGPAAVLRPWIAGRCGSAVSPPLSSRPARRRGFRPFPAPWTWSPGTGSRSLPPSPSPRSPHRR